MSENWNNLFSTSTENPNFSQVRDVAATEVFEKKDTLVLIDVRETHEYNAELGHIDGTKLIVMNTIPNHLDEIPKDKPVVFICRSGGRSSQVAAFCMDQGYENVFNMKGGMLMWNQLMLPKI